MCFDTGCEAGDVDRRSFLVGGATALAGYAALAAEGAAQEEQPPPTRVLDESLGRLGTGFLTALAGNQIRPSRRSVGPRSIGNDSNWEMCSPIMTADTSASKASSDSSALPSACSSAVESMSSK